MEHFSCWERLRELDVFSLERGEGLGGPDGPKRSQETRLGCAQGQGEVAAVGRWREGSGGLDFGWEGPERWPRGPLRSLLSVAFKAQLL